MTISAEDRLRALLDERIAVLDGAMGTMIQRAKLEEADFRGAQFKDHWKDVKGNNDLLSLTRPDVIRSIHEAYYEAGSNIVETNTFNATGINQAEYGLAEHAYAINVAAARVAGEARDIWTDRDPKIPRFVAGSIGPLAKSLSFSPKVDDASFRTVTFDEVKETYKEQIRGLLDGGVDLLLPETAFDTLNMKAAIVAIDEVFAEGGRKVPVMLSLTIVDKSGRNLSGQLTDAWYTSIQHAHPLSVGINCSLGGNDIRPYIAELAGLASELVSCYPNAGLPNPLGEFDETPEITARLLRSMAEEGLLNFAGGCCGTTPAPKRRTTAAFSRKSASPSFRLIELTIALPCTHFSPATMTSNFDESIITGTRAISGSVAMMLRNVVMAAAPSSMPSSMLTSMMFAPLLTCSSAIWLPVW